MDKTQTYSIRPAGRHILTVGRDLIQDQYAAIVELVKNAYDADSPDVNITFSVSRNLSRKPKNIYTLKITIRDNGHGMSRDTVINNWLVPSTDDKLNRRQSPKGRLMQGRKGVGRYAASILGDDLLLETITPKGQKTTVYIKWNDFENAKFLDDVEILVKTVLSNESPGTLLTITGGDEHLAEWDERQIDKLRFELKKLIPPPINMEASQKLTQDTFSINLTFEDCRKGQERTISEEITPYPIVELYDYRINGTFEPDGSGSFVYFNQKARNTLDEKVSLNLGKPTGCGRLTIDIRAYDREGEAIEKLIERGLKDEKGNYLGKLQARQLLNVNNGIGVYRNGFRIRPLGDPDFDWLRLNEQRIQNPSLRIGLNQVIGYVQIESEEKSNLIEKSARDGLRENQAYKRLFDLTLLVINELEIRRFAYRKKAGLSRVALKIEHDLEKLFTFDEVKQKVRSKLVKSGVHKQEVDEIINVITKKEEESIIIVDNIRQAVATYQGQATLGKIINVILHEGRRPLNYFKNQIPNLNFWANELKTNYEPETLEELIPIADGLGHNADVFVQLFGRLDPLATRKRGSKREFNLFNAINNAVMVFENELVTNGIVYKINCSKDFIFTGWSQDIYVIIANLIDNSIFWMLEKQSPIKQINITVSEDDSRLAYIDYRDTGPGIEPYLIKSEVIFEPEFSTKNSGTGLGLAIAGEAATRNSLELKAFESNSGAYFRLQPI